MDKKDILRMLPEMFQQAVKEKNPVDAFTGVMEMLHAPVEEKLRDYHMFFEPYGGPDTFVTYVSTWVDMDWVYGEEVHPTELPAIRQLIANAWYLSKWRGTAKGLLAFLETATGVSGFIVDEAPIDQEGRLLPFHIRVIVPKTVTSYLHIVERIVAREKPAYVTSEVVVLEE